MNITKSLMLGTAAGFVAMSGAQAADLPVKAKAVEYVKICSLYGAGFYYIPGTDTCIRIGGALRLDTTLNGGTYDTANWQGGAGGANAYNRNYFADRERLNLFIDTRTSTEYGVVRTYANLQFDFLAASSRENIAGGFMENDFLFIQFAGFTFGKAVSMFDPQWALAKPTIASGFLAGSNDATGIPMLAYTAQFGNGVSGTISLEDAQPYRSAGVVNTSAAFGGPFGVAAATYGGAGGVNTFVGNAQTGDHVPDIVGNIRLDQAWGSLHFGAAAHEVHGTYYTAASSDSSHPASAWGYAFTGAFELKNLPTGVGDSFKAEATWGHGAAKYTFGGTVDTNGEGRFAATNSGAGTGGSMGYALVMDGVYGGLGTAASPGTGIALSTTWDVSAYYEHYWTPAWRTSVFGSYSHISYGSAGNALLVAAANAGMLSTGTFGGTQINTGNNFSASLPQIGTKTAWTPVANLTLSAEFIYSRINQNQNGTFTAVAGAIPGAAAGTTYSMKNQNAYNGAFQILRSF